MILNNRATQLEDLLDKMAEEVQLDSSRYQRMVTSYESVKKWIENDQSFFGPFNYDVYPHGSVRILTTVKPFGKDEFDLDVAVHLASNVYHTPQRIFEELKRCIGEYAKAHGLKLKIKKRCVRLDYAGDYHMDILPGVQESDYDRNKIKVPDRELGDWVSSNPRGYADWFIAKANLVKESLLEKALRAENLPVDDFKNKKPLQRAVQLIKRYRDIYFQDNDEYKTSSIILTTIAGHFYQGEESIFDSIDNIVNNILAETSRPAGRLKILNPVNSEEDFTDKWDNEPEYYLAFKQFATHLYDEWQKLKMKNGVIEESNTLKGLFGNDVLIKAHSKQTELLESYRNANQLRINKTNGILTTSAIESTKVKTNTFFGD
ncbi:SMODS domain-containing nucleotidyltransferase [Fluviicola sp.]|uniref:SMODS domain-containing nucleotidyltransferase n=1 Tax=Fluviicola sp. TaxID=1917219 RepID=UPI003D2BD24B